jgi:peroxiredoxin Q/BCP
MSETTPEETRMLRFLVILSIFCVPVLASGVEVGDAAPDFTLPGSDGQQYSLKQFVGKKPVVVAWYPKAFTGG